MTTAEEILIVGAVINLLYGFVTGFMIGKIRMSEPETPKYLMLAHTGPLMQGPMLLGLVFAIQMSMMSEGFETIAAALLVAGSILLAAKETVNWLQGVGDEFAEKPILGMVLGALSVLTSTTGLVMVAIGVFGAFMG